VFLNNNWTPTYHQQVNIYIGKALIPMTWLYHWFLDIEYEEPN
jgi:hypothetical protein